MFSITLKKYFKWGSYLLLLAILVWGWDALHSAGRFPIKQVIVSGQLQHINQKVFQKAMEPLVTGGFFSLDIAGIAQRAEQFPWVDQIEVRRVWPAKVNIVITEKEPFARWNNDSLVTAQGQIFMPKSLQGIKPLPLLCGPDKSQNLMITTYKKMQSQLTPLHLSIAQLDLSPRYAWRMTLGDGTIIKLGRENIYTRLARFVLAYPKSFQNKPLKSVDLRYSNGFAVSFADKSSKTT